MFSLESSAKWGFTYHAALLRAAYTGDLSITNPSTEAMLYGVFNEWASDCPLQDYNFLVNWFESEGLLCKNKLFNKIPLGGLDCGEGNNKITWKCFTTVNDYIVLKSYLNNVETGYRITTAFPINSNSVNFDSITGKVLNNNGLEREIDIEFKFKIVPVDSKFRYIKKGEIIRFFEIPFIVIPYRDK